MASMEAGMKKMHKNCLRLNLIYLTTETLLDALCDSLKENGVMKEDWIDDILSYNKPSRDTCHDLLDRLKRSGPKAWEGFLTCLDETDQKHIAWRLRETENCYRENPTITARELKEYFVANPAPSELLPKPEKKASLHSHSSMVHINSEFYGQPHPNAKRNEANCYRMNSKPRGFMLIINNVKFTDGQTERLGSDQDRDRLMSMFEGFGFHVISKDNLDKKKMEQKIQMFAKDANNFKDIDSIIVAVLSHGGDGVVYGVDGSPLKVDDLIAPFNGIRSPNLIGKPKLFILQVCRGRDYRMGIPSTDGPESGPKAGPSNSIMVQGGESQDKPAIPTSVDEELSDAMAQWHLDLKEAPRYVHPDNDMLLAYSTLPGQLSYRDDNKGSWYVQALCNVFQDQAQDVHVLDMLVRTNREIMKFGMKSHVQCPIPMVRLTKDWFLNPL